MKKIKVRFNLGQGKNFMKWKIEYITGKVEYHIPAETQLIMKSCTLKNFKTVAKSIFIGANKTVCAWVLCEEILVLKKHFVKLGESVQENKIRYNPRVAPHWMFNDINVDGIKMESIISVDRGLYKVK